MSRPVLPLVRLRQLQPVLDFLAQIGVDSRALLERASLPTRLLDRQWVAVPGQLIYRFVGLAAEHLDLPDLGARAGATIDLESWETSTRAMGQTLPLRDRIRLLHEEFHRESSHIRLWHTETPLTGAEMHYDGSAGPEIEGFAQVEQYMVVVLSRFIARSLGRPWQPSQVRLRADSCRGLEASPHLSGSRFLVGQDTTSLTIPRHLLWSPPLRTRESGTLAATSGASHFLDRLRGSIAPFIEEGPLDLQRAAELTNLAPRTLQRRLAEHGTSFSLESERVRRDQALRRVTETDAPLLDIAMGLGYSDQAHFTRAFKRWTGMAPRTYRQTHARGPAVSERTPELL